MNTVKIVGMGMSPKDLTETHLNLIQNADVLVGGKRHLSYFEDLSSEKIIISKHIRELAEDIGTMAKTLSVVVIASGDPLFYGIGSVLAETLGKDTVEIFPNINSVAGAFSKIKEPWQDAGVISLHGRKPDDGLMTQIRKHHKVAVFTDPVNSPDVLAKGLLENGLVDYDMCVLEQLGTDKETITWLTVDEAVHKTFQDPNMVILKRSVETNLHEAPELRLGMPESQFSHQNGLITKPEVRAVTLSKLRLKEGLVMWDLGAGSGSVSVEASQFIGNGAIYAVEQHKDRIDDIKANIEKYGITNITAVNATLPEGMDDLPVPDRVFIGGGGRDLGTIIRECSRRIGNDGIIVINTVLLSNINTAVSELETSGFKTEVVQIQVSVSHEMPWDRMMKAQNPVWIITGCKNGD